ncbi:MAG: hypothetical protein WCJ14_07830 [Verrucomicrobiota bacterium]
MLPPKKPKPAASKAADRQLGGLRLGSETPCRLVEEPANPLEVRAIDGRVLRLAPEAPPPTRVPRLINYQALPTGPDPRRAAGGEGKWGLARTPSVRWVVGTCLGVSSVVILALLLLPLINESNAARPGPTGLVLDKAEPTGNLAPINDLLPRQPEAEQLFKTFASAAIAADVAPLVREAAIVVPLIRARQRPALVSKAWQPHEATVWNVLENDGHPYALLEGTLPDFSKFSAYCVMEGNQLRLDWKATTGYGTATFEELARNQGDAGEIRAKILSARFYTAIYPEAEYQSYQLVSPDESQAIWGYTRRGEVADGVLGQLFWSGEILDAPVEQRKVTVRLERGAAGSLPNQWRIAEMLHNDWLNP